MTGFYIFLSVVLVLVLLLILPILLLFRYENGNRKVFVKYLYFTLPFFSGKKKKKPSKGQKKTEESGKKDNGKKEKQDLHDILSLIGFLAKESFRGVSAVRRFIVFDKIYLDCKIIDEDAAKTAIRCGELQILAGTTFAILQNFFKLKFDAFSITPDFTGEKNDLKLSFRVRTPLAVALFIGARFFIRLVLKKLDDESGGKVYGKTPN